MTRVRLSDLPPDIRRQVEASTAAAGSRTRKRSRAGVGLSAPCPGHCGCGEAFPTAARWEAHAKQSGHRVWSIDLP